MPILSRLYTPNNFGVYGSYTASLSVLSSFVSLQYSQVIVLVKRDKDGINLFFISCLSVVCCVAISVLAIFLFPEAFQSILKDSTRIFLILLPMSLFTLGMSQSFQSWNVRVKAFSQISKSNIVKAFSSILIWGTVGFLNIGALGLVLGSLLSEMMACLILTKPLRQDLNKLAPSTNLYRMKQLAYAFRDFPIYSAPQKLMNAISQGLPVLALCYFYGAAVGGAYAFSIKVLQIPMGLILTPLRQVLIQKASELHNRGDNLSPLFLKTSLSLLCVAIIPSTIIFLWAPELFSMFFGNAWLDSGIYSKWLILWFLIAFTNVPSVLFSQVMRQQRKLFLYESIVMLTRVGVLIIGGQYFSALLTIKIFSALGVILNLLLITSVGIFLYNRSSEYC